MTTTLTPEELIAAGALVVANHSGGKDSQATLIRLLEIVPKAQIVVVHASLGDAEWPGALELAQKQAADAGLPFIVAKATKTIFEMVERRYQARPEVPSFPSAAHRQCTSDLKRGPIQREVRRFAKANGFKVIINALGLRAQESPARAKRDSFHRMDAASNSVLTWFEWLPVHDLTAAEVFATIRDAGQEPHYAYSLGNERLSCVFCIMASRRDLQNGARHHPELLARYSELEQRTGYTMHQSQRSLVEIAAS